MSAIDIRPPKDWSKEEIDSFLESVRAGGEVMRGLKARVERAELLAIQPAEGSLPAVAGLKRPDDSYREKVFEKSGSQEVAATYLLELGWVFVPESLRRQSVAFKLTEWLVSCAGSKKIFATTRTDNAPMKKILISTGFCKNGTPYASDQNPGSMLQLFIKN